MMNKVSKGLWSGSKYIIILINVYLLGCNHLKMNEFVVEGNISSYQANYLILAYQDSIGEFILDTVKVTNGKFSYRKQTLQPVVAFLVARDPRNGVSLNGKNIAPDFIALFIEPGTKLEVKIDNNRWPEIYMKGGVLNNDLMLLYDKILPLRYEAFDILRKYCLEDLTEEEQIILENQRKALKNQDIEEQKKFIISHTSSFAAMYLLGTIRNAMSFEEYTTAFYKFSHNVRNTPLGKRMDTEINMAQRSLVGTIALDFEKADKDGKVIRLSDYKGKYVLLDFWGTWCSPCRASHPHLREIETKYGPHGLVVINIAQEGNRNARETWLKAIAEDKMTWTQILNNEGIEKCDVVKLFSITAFPTKVLIDPQGKIAVRAVGESEPIDAKLKEVYGE